MPHAGPSSLSVENASAQGAMSRSEIGLRETREPSIRSGMAIERSTGLRVTRIEYASTTVAVSSVRLVSEADRNGVLWFNQRLVESSRLPVFDPSAIDDSLRE